MPTKRLKFEKTTRNMVKYSDPEQSKEVMLVPYVYLTHVEAMGPNGTVPPREIEVVVKVIA